MGKNYSSAEVIENKGIDFAQRLIDQNKDVPGSVFVIGCLYAAAASLSKNKMGAQMGLNLLAKFYNNITIAVEQDR